MPSVSERLRAAGEPFKAAIWFGLIAGAARALRFVIRRSLSDSLAWTGDFVIWAAPLGHVLLFSAVALFVAGIAFVAPRRVPSRVAIAVFAALAAFSFLLYFPGVHHLASFVLALGIGVQTAWWVSKSPERRRMLLARTATAIGVATVLCAIATPIAKRVAERRAIRALATPAANEPNVLLVMIDAGRARSMSTYGYRGATTPNLTRLGSEGIVFDRAMSTTSWTLPSTASILTGQYPTALSTDWLRPLDNGAATLPEVLRARGYLTGAFSANLHYFTRATGLNRGVIRFKDYRVTIPEILLTVSLAQSTLARDLRTALLHGNVGDALRSLIAFDWARPTGELAHDRKPAEAIVREFLDWQSIAGDRPWFAALNFFDAHAPYKPQPPFDKQFGAATQEQLYLGALATIDREMGRMFDELRRRGAFDRTVVIVTADHGELFGEHGWEHGGHLYLPLIHVPLVMRAPGKIPAGKRVRQTVSLRDLAATVASLVDPSSADEPSLGGRSLAWTWGEEGAPPSAAFSALSDTPNRNLDTPVHWKFLSIIDDSLHYIRNDEGRELLFDVNADPIEKTSLAARPEYAARLGALRARVDSVFARTTR